MHKYKLMKIDIENFYPSIKERLLKDALNFFNKTTQITEKKKKSLTQQNLFLYQRRSMNKRKNFKKEDKLFEFTIGGKHEAEECELIWLYTLQGLKNILLNLIIGLNRYDVFKAVEKKIKQCRNRKN